METASDGCTLDETDGAVRDTTGLEALILYCAQFRIVRTTSARTNI